jgi:hypothetical protein
MGSAAGGKQKPMKGIHSWDEGFKRCVSAFFTSDLSTAGQLDYHESPNFMKALLGEALSDGAHPRSSRAILKSVRNQ